MSGTSADGIDAALVDVEDASGRPRAKTIAYTTVPYSPDIRNEILLASTPSTGTVDRICRLNVLLGEAFARAAHAVVDQAGLTFNDVDLIASHGQTIHHAVTPNQETSSTLQIGAPAVIAERSGRTVVADFRPRDVAAGGQGAPLASYVDYLLFADANAARAVQNIGGIGNVTYIPSGATPAGVVAFDTGPGNMIVDALTRALFDLPFDRDGDIAATGRVDEGWIESLLDDPFYRTPPPKSTGREKFGAEFVDAFLHQGRSRGLRDPDLVATATALTTCSIAGSYSRFFAAVDEVVLSGGGAENHTVVHWLTETLIRRFPSVAIRRSDDFGVPSDAKEAIVFAILGYETIHARAGTLPSCTGARHPVVLGSIVPGDNYLDLIRHVTRPGRRNP
jgi:anhydro-N-acetylmuramic acid kinase